MMELSDQKKNTDVIKKTRISKTRSIIIQGLKILFGLLLLYFSIYQMDWAAFLDAVRLVSPFWIVIALLSVLLGLMLKVWRWSILLKNYGKPTNLKKLSAAFFLGQAANILLIVRGGEVVRIGWAHVPEREDLVEITATIGLEKYLDLVMLVLVMVAGSSFLPELAKERLSGLTPVIIAGTVGLLIAVLVGPLVWSWIRRRWRFQGFLGKIQEKLDRFVQASLWLRKPARLLPALGTTVVIWVVMALTNMLLFKALDLPLGWEASALVLVLVFLGILPALMPGNVGPFSYFAQLALMPFAVQSELAFAFAILLYVIVTLPPLLIAGGFLLFSKWQTNGNSK